MRLVKFSLMAALVFTFSIGVAIAQPPGGRGGPQGRQRGPREGFRPPTHPVIEALDADRDGVISAKEIEQAVSALKKLDKNGDGELSGDEIRPQFGAGGPGGPGGRPGGGIGGPPGRGGPGGPGGGFAPDTNVFVERMMGLDKNKDGKLSKDELPERMQLMFERADENQDEVLDKSELQKLATRFGRRAGGGGQRGQRGGGGNRPDRPQRPNRPNQPDTL